MSAGVTRQHHPGADMTRSPALSRARTRSGAPSISGAWWRRAVVYQVYLRSFADADGDGVGDIRGVIDHLDHLAWLGVDVLWLSPVMRSPNADWGYDISDYEDVDSELGSLADLDELIGRCAAHGIRVILDIAPNHTSDRHPWFVDARSSSQSRHRDWYVWADPGPDGRPPNNWIDFSGAPAWTFDPPTGQWYLHNFLPAQPDLNWWNPEVRRAFDSILRFWLDRGVAGFRIDTCNVIVKDRRLRDNPAATARDHPLVRLRGQREVYNANRPEVHAVLRRWRRLCELYDPPRLLLGETWFFDLSRLARYYGHDDEIQLAMNFPFVFSPFAAGALRSVVEATEAALPAFAWPAWFGSNHDVPRLATRWCAGDPARISCALLILLTLRGTPILYGGDEIGMANVAVPPDRVRDPLGRGGRPGRDGSRTPMRWTRGPNAGFTVAGATPWLPVGDADGSNVESQRGDPRSILHLCRDLVALRRERADLRDGDQACLPSPPAVWARRRGGGTIVAVNLSDNQANLDDVCGQILICTDRSRDGERVEGTLSVRPWEGVVVGG